MTAGSPLKLQEQCAPTMGRIVRFGAEWNLSEAAAFETVKRSIESWGGVARGESVEDYLESLRAEDLAVALVNRAVMAVLGPLSLPRLELRDGVPPGLRTLVVVPTLLTSEADIEEQVGRLEIHFLANPAGDLHFALLSDWVDAPTEAMPEDEQLLAAARDGIARLNARNGPAPPAGSRFLLLHRKRLWNAGERFLFIAASNVIPSRRCGNIPARIGRRS